jgi:hypothetical protein
MTSAVQEKVSVLRFQYKGPVQGFCHLTSSHRCLYFGRTCAFC